MENSSVIWVLASPQVAVGGDGLEAWKVAANVLS
jgi:hypothetical protein